MVQPSPPTTPPPPRRQRHDDCRPPAGQAYLTIGQDLLAIQDYLQTQYNLTLHDYIKAISNTGPSSQSSQSPHPPTPHDVWPAAFMVYTDLATLAGLDIPTHYGSGVEYANGLSDVDVESAESADTAKHVDAEEESTTTSSSSSQVGLQVGLWLSGHDGCQAVVNGTWMPQVHKLVTYLSHAPFYRIFLRIGYEFDNPSFGYYYNDGKNTNAGGMLYRQAFRRIVAECRKIAACRHKTLFVWHSWAAGLLPYTSLDAFYPGDDVVDWIGISVFQQLYADKNTGNTSSENNNNIWSGGNRQTLQRILDFAAAHDDKPVMIAESTPFGGIDEKVHDAWNNWFRPVLDLMFDANNNIAMWSYIDCDWNALPMWHGVGFGDTRVGVKNQTIATQLWPAQVRRRLLGYGSLPLYCTSRDDDNNVDEPSDIENDKNDKIRHRRRRQDYNSRVADLLPPKQGHQERWGLSSSSSSSTTNGHHNTSLVGMAAAAAVLATLLFLIVSAAIRFQNRRKRRASYWSMHSLRATQQQSSCQNQEHHPSHYQQQQEQRYDNQGEKQPFLSSVSGLSSYQSVHTA